MTPVRRKMGSWLGLMASVASTLFGKSVKPATDDLQRAEFKTSTQRMGVRFTDKIRNVFRGRWLKKS
jgi:hypothetical protein